MLDPNDSKTTPFAFFSEVPAESPAAAADAPAVVVDAPDQGPMSGGARQKKLREYRKNNGIKALHISPGERELLAKSLRLFGRVSFSPERASGDVAALLARVAPDGPQGQELDDFALLEVGDADLQPHWEGYRSDFARAATALGMLRLRNNQHAELVRAVHTLQRQLMEAGLEDQALGDRGKWYWNKTPLRDYRAESAPEHMERQSAGLSVLDERDTLAREVEALKADVEALKLARDRAIQDYWRGQDALTAMRKENDALKNGLQEIAGELAGKPLAATKAESVAASAAALDLAQLNESELELLKSALTEHHEKNKSVLWKDVACESLWKRITLLQLNQVEPHTDPFARWGDDPRWSKSALQVATGEARKVLAEGLAQVKQ